jgi:CIC family chloride channel protein
LCGTIGWLYARGFYGITHIFHHLSLPNWIKPAIGGLLVGLIGLVLPQALGMGYGWVQVAMGPGLLALPLWIIVLIPFAKIVTTGLSIGSGGSGGIFGPGMVIGAMVGAVVWRISYHVLPGVPDSPTPFVIVGMMALFGGIAHAPLAVMLMVAEMTGNLSMLAPAMIAVGISSAIVGEATIYTSQVDTRADSPAHRFQLSIPLLSTMAVRQAMTPIIIRFSPRQMVAEAESQLAERALGGGPVLDEKGNLLGVLTLADIQRVPAEEREKRPVEDAMNRDVLFAHPDDTLDVALEQLTSHRIGWMPVVELGDIAGSRRDIGRISALDIMRAYRETSARGARRMRGLVEGTVMIEATIKPEMRVAGRTLREAKLPPESLVISIRRQNELLFPRGSVVIEPGDVVTFLVNPRSEDLLNAYLADQKDIEKPQPSDTLVSSDKKQ